jgi:hypothetical protein
MATAYPIGRRYRVTSVDNGKFGELGDASPALVGAFMLQFVPDASFAGSIGILARAAGKDAKDDNVGYASIAYRRVQMNGQASDYALITDGTPLASDFTILIPASGLAVAVLVECTAGFGYLYSTPLEGPPAP